MNESGFTDHSVGDRKRNLEGTLSGQFAARPGHRPPDAPSARGSGPARRGGRGRQHGEPEGVSPGRTMAPRMAALGESRQPGDVRRLRGCAERAREEARRPLGHRRNAWREGLRFADFRRSWESSHLQMRNRGVVGPTSYCGHPTGNMSILRALSALLMCVLDREARTCISASEQRYTDVSTLPSRGLMHAPRRENPESE